MLNLTLQLQRDRFTLEAHGHWPVRGIVGLYGHSGAGKTSVLRGIAGLLPVQGELALNGQQWLSSTHAVPAHQRDIGYVFQDARLLPHLSVEGNLRYAWRRRSDAPGLDWDTVIDALELRALLKQPAPLLSGGQAQRVALGRALLTRPRLLLLDEPLASLDAASRGPLLELLARLPARCGLGMIYVSHSLEEISRLANYLVLMAAGRIIAQGPALELLHRLDLPLAHEDNAAALVDTRILDYCPRDRLTTLALSDGQSLWLAGQHGTPGAPLRLRIPARDVSLALTRSTDTSMLNILRVRIDAMHDDEQAYVSLRLAVGDQCLLARVTHRSARLLQLSPGQTVFAQIKSVALLSDREAAIRHA